MRFDKKMLVLAIVSIALVLITVDMTVLYITLPQLTHDLAANANDKIWIVNIYPLVVSGLLLGTGALGDRFGHRRLFLLGLAVFGGASLIAAFAPSAISLIAARALLGVGAAIMMPATLAIIRLTFVDERERAMAFGIWSAVASAGAAIGPLIGGGLLEYFWWGSVFLINVPIMLIAWLLTLFCVPAGQPDRRRHWDLPSTLQGMAALFSLVFAIKEFAKPAPEYSYLLAALASCGVFTAGFIRRQRHSVAPLIDLTLFRDRLFSSSVLAAMVSSACLMGIDLALSQRLQLVSAWTPIQTGLFFLPLSLAAMGGSLASGWLLPRLTRPPRLLIAALLTYSLGAAGFLLFYDATMAQQMICLLLLGGAVGATLTCVSNFIMHHAPPERAGMVASLEEIAYELGAALGITIMGSIMSRVYSNAVDETAIGVDIRDSLDRALIVAENLPPETAALVKQIAWTAFDRSFVCVMATSMVILLLTAGLVWCAVRGQSAARPDSPEPVPGCEDQ